MISCLTSCITPALHCNPGCDCHTCRHTQSSWLYSPIRGLLAQAATASPPLLLEQSAIKASSVCAAVPPLVPGQTGLGQLSSLKENKNMPTTDTCTAIKATPSSIYCKWRHPAPRALATKPPPQHGTSHWQMELNGMTYPLHLTSRICSFDLSWGPVLRPWKPLVVGSG